MKRIERNEKKRRGFKGKEKGFNLSKQANQILNYSIIKIIETKKIYLYN